MVATLNQEPAPVKVVLAAVVEDLLAAEVAGPRSGGDYQGSRHGVGVIGSPPDQLKMVHGPGD